MLCEHCGNDIDPTVLHCPYCERPVTPAPSGGGGRRTYRVVNMKTGWPTVDEVQDHLLDELDRAFRDGVRALKLIHGYGSSGVGGRLRTALRRSLTELEKDGYIHAVIPGEAFLSRSAKVVALLKAVPAVCDDHDLDRHNIGVTLVVL